jgi:hypothetical protein
LLDGGSAAQLVFGPYFLVPFGLAVAVVLLELGIIGRHAGVKAVAMVMPLGLAVVAGVGHSGDAVYAEFLGVFAARLGGSPLFLTLCVGAGFYLYAWARRVPLAAEGLTVVLAGLAFVRPGTVALSEPAAPAVLPLVLAVGLQLGLGLWRREGWRLVIGGVGPVVWAVGSGWRTYRFLREHVAGLDYLVLGLVLLPVSVLISLEKAGLVSRWLAGLRGSPPPASEPEA